MPSLTGLLLAAASVTASPAAPPAPIEKHGPPEPTLPLSAGVLELLRAEMRELQNGTQAVAVALPTGDWNAIVATSRKMKESYILEKKITPEQEKELAALPEHFKVLDSTFHARLGKIADAAAARDAEMVAYQLSRVLETCVACHAVFAHSRFPSLTAAPAGHGH